MHSPAVRFDIIILLSSAPGCGGRANLGKTLRFLKNRGIGFVAGQHTNNGNRQNNPTPSGMRHWRSLKTRPQQLLDIVIEDLGCEKDALLGTFEDDHGHDYFMIINLWHHEKMSASDAAQTVVLKFDSKAKYVTHLSRETGVCENLILSNGLLRLKRHGGTGDFFKLHDEQFPGL